MLHIWKAPFINGVGPKYWRVDFSHKHTKPYLTKPRNLKDQDIFWVWLLFQLEKISVYLVCADRDPSEAQGQG